MTHRVRPVRLFAAVPAVAGLMAAAIAGTASATELRDAEIAAGGSPFLHNDAGTVRLVARLGRPISIPEPDGVLQLGTGIGFLALLALRRRGASSGSRHPAKEVVHPMIR